MAQGRHKLTHEEVKNRLDGTGVRWIGRYESSQKKVRVGCEKCGHEWMVMPGNLFTKTRCPACYSREGRGLGRAGSGRRKHNDVLADHGDWLVLDIGTPRTPNSTMLIDRKDYDNLVKRGANRIHIGKFGYARCRVNSKTRLVHRMILDGAKEVDHINQDKLDNRRENLREVESWQNQANRRVMKNSRLGVKGVSWKEKSKRYYAQHKFRGVIVHQSYHKTLEAAIKAREESVRVHCGEYAPRS